MEAEELARRHVRQALSQRYMVARAVEREGFRRVVIACVIFVGYRFVKQRFFNSGSPS